MRKRWLFLLAVLLLFPVWRALTQDTPTLDITGVNATQMPEITITTTVTDNTGRFVPGLTTADFTLTGSLAERARIVRVENITSDNLAFASVLVIDTSSSMAGEPFAKALEAARLFVNSVGANDPIAIITFNTDVHVVLPFTTDKSVLLSTIDQLRFGGKTALYEATVTGIETAASSDLPRRAVVLLSDGAEFGGTSNAAREDALERATALGVSVYTIGLGFGNDRTYLDQLSTGTNARFYESPMADQLTTIYGELAALFRSQYVVTLAFDVYDVRGDAGAEYDLTLQANTPQGATNADSANVRIPAPVPVIKLPDGLLDAPLSEPVTVVPDILADDGIASTTFTIGDTTTTGDNLTIVPATLQPGDYTLTITSTDNSGDSTTLDADFTIAALPSDVIINWTPGDTPVTEPQTVTITTSGQTTTSSATYTVGSTTETSTDATTGFAFTFDPFTLPPGDATLTVDVLNAGGVTTTVEQAFVVGAVAPQITSITGISDGQVIDVPVTVGVEATTQPGALVNSTAVSVNGTPLSGLEIDPAAISPGGATVTIAITDSAGQVTEQTIDVVIAALPPIITIQNLDGAELSTSTEVGLSFESQTPLTTITYVFDEGAPTEIAAGASTFITVPVNVDGLGDGTHTMTVTANNEGGQSGTAQATFSVKLPTPTPTNTFTPSPTATNTPSPTFTPSPTVDRTGTAEAAALIVQSTARAEATDNANATANAEATGAAQATADAQTTSNAQATTDSEATTAAEATNNAQATADTLATTQAQATSDIQATGTALAEETAVFILTETLAVDAALDAEATARAQETTSARSTAIAEANLNAQATATADAQATLGAVETATAIGDNATATADTILTLTAADFQDSAALDRTATAFVAEVTQTAGAQLTLTAAALDRTATAFVAAITQTARADATTASEGTSVALANITATAIIEANVGADQTATAQAEASQTTQAGGSATANAESTEIAIGTQNAEETLDAQATLDTQATSTNTLAPTDTDAAAPTDEVTATEEATSQPTFTPVAIVELPDSGTPPAQTNQTVVVAVLCGSLALLFILVFLFWYAGRRRR